MTTTKKRATLVYGPGSVEITIPSPKYCLLIGFFSVWLYAWGMVELIILYALLKGEKDPSGPGLLFYIPWTFGGLFFLRFYIWFLFGKEIITIEQGQLRIVKKNLVFYKPRIYELHKISNFRVQPFTMQKPYGWHKQNSGTRGYLQFNYGNETLSFGEGLDNTEAQAILDELREKNILDDQNFAEARR